MVVVIRLLSENLSEMVLIYHKDMVKTLFTNRSHPLLNESICFGGLIRCVEDFNPF
jgi:hypothetical protein